MKKTMSVAVVLAAAIYVHVSATTINVPGDYATIQGGINASSDGDTVLVQPGTYVENITFNGHNIVLGSLFLTSGDASYISSTVIDGDSAGSVVTLVNGEDSTTVITGFTIQNGFSNDDGGGIYCIGSNPTVSNNTITENTATGCGGGIYCEGSHPRLTNAIVRGNTAFNGGGIFCQDSNPILRNVTVCRNTAYEGGGGMCFDGSTPTFHTSDRCNIYLNNALAFKDLTSGDSPTITVVVDTFTVMNPTNYHAAPVGSFAFDILHAKVQQAESNLYVSAGGDNTNSGLSPAEPLQTISFALSKLVADRLHPRTVYLADGTYSPSTTMESFPLHVSSYISLSGESETGVILNAESQGCVIIFWGGREFTIENVTVTGGLMEWGGGIICLGASPNLVNLTITGNSTFGRHWGVPGGGGIGCLYSSPRLENVTISKNATEMNGGGIACLMSSPRLENVTIRENKAEMTGGGVYCDESSLSFDPVNRCNIYHNHAGLGNDLFAFASPAISVVVDTFTVLNPTDYHAFPLDNFTFDILHAKVGQVGADLYVSPDGDDANSGLSPAEPLRTISLAVSRIVADSLHRHTIYLADGIYSPSTNGEHYPIALLNDISLSGNSQKDVTLDAEDQNGVIISLLNRGIRIENLTITGGSTYDGGGIYCEESSLSVENVAISGNRANGKGGGIYCKESRLSLENVTIYRNKAEEGGGIFCEGSGPNLMNVTISENGATDKGGGILASGGSNPIIVNTILWNNVPQEIYYTDLWDQDTLHIAYSNVQGGLDSIVAGFSMYWLEGNKSAEPLFIDAANEDYHLSDASPCIAAGIDSIKINGAWFYAPSTDIEGNPRPNPAGSNPDMGAYENPSGPVGLKGDANGDGSVNVLDVVSVVRHILGIQLLEGDALWRADCNGDGTIDVPDVLGIVNAILKLGECGPVACKA